MVLRKYGPVYNCPETLVFYASHLVEKREYHSGEGLPVSVTERPRELCFANLWSIFVPDHIS